MNPTIEKWFFEHEADALSLADNIWKRPELAFSEHYATQTVADYLRAHGIDDVRTFDIRHTDGKPNCIVAKYGSGTPVIGILGEYDALPGLAQDVRPYKTNTEGAGHACGHNLMAMAAASAMCSLKTTMEAEHLNGTIVFFGCPAEEVVTGKAYMIHEHLFDGVDASITWHPMENAPSPQEIASAAIYIVHAKFHGLASHAGNEPWNGRSALDAAELTNVAIQYLREHITTDSRVNYSYVRAGEAPNIVPEEAEVRYFVRTSRMDTCSDLLERVKKCALGAAVAIETMVDFEIKGACFDTLLNFALNQAVYDAACEVPEIEYTDEEIAYAKEAIRQTLGHDLPERHDPLPRHLRKPVGHVIGLSGGSSDVGDVSYIMPTAQFWGNARITGLPNHHWNQTALSGSSIGHKGALYAGKVLAESGYRLLKHPEIIQAAWAEHRKSIADRYEYFDVIERFPE